MAHEQITIRETNPPCFLVGAERSGTTVMGLMLDCHPSLSWFHHFDWAVSFIENDGTWPDTNAYAEKLATTWGFRVWGLSVDRTLSYSELQNDFLEQRRIREKKSRSGATVHSRFSDLVRIMPNATFIHIVRDPRDVALSVIAKGWAANAWMAIKRWVEAENQWTRLCQVVPPERRHEVTFEELIANVEQVMRGVCNFIGVQYTDEIYQFSAKTPYSMVNGRLPSNWKDTMAARDVRLVESAVGGLMELRGYARTVPNTGVSLWKRRWLHFQDRFFNIRKNIRMLGVSLWTVQSIARRVGPPAVHRWAQRKIDKVYERTVRGDRMYIGDPNLHP